MTSKIITDESGTDFAIGAKKRVRFPRSPWLGLALTLAAVWVCRLPLLSAGQTNASAPAYLPNRYLLVVETSKAMQPHKVTVAQLVDRLVNSAIASQAHPGDTIGVWTYNDELYAGGLPLQKWSAPTPSAISDRISKFLSDHKFEKTAQLEKVIPALNRLNKNSQFITIILVCRGDKDIEGTPFDAIINQFFRTWRLKEEDAGAPFVIALRGQAGAFVDYTLNPSPWPPELPVLPKELLTPLKPAPIATLATNKPAAARLPPLIVSGHKRDASQDAPSVQPAQPVTANASTVVSNSSALSQPALPAAQTAPLASRNENSGPGTKVESNQTSAPMTASVPANAGAGTSSVPGASSLISATNSSALIENTGKSERPSVMAANNGSAAAITPPAAAVAPSPTRRLALIVTGTVTFLAIVGAVILWKARPQRTAETSIITESLDRRKK